MLIGFRNRVDSWQKGSGSVEYLYHRLLVGPVLFQSVNIGSLQTKSDTVPFGDLFTQIHARACEAQNLDSSKSHHPPASPTNMTRHQHYLCYFFCFFSTLITLYQAGLVPLMVTDLIFHLIFTVWQELSFARGSPT